MLRDKQIDVASGGFLPPPDETITIVYKPVDMGLLGWRIFVTRKELLDKINSVKNAGDLKNYSFGQGSQWNDTYILKSVGLEVITVNKLSNLFGMLQASRFDLLPLGATEVYDYFERFGAQYPDLTIENTVTLVYPFARFFYIRKDSKELKKAIELGMEKALADGSLLSLLKSHPVTQDAFSRAKLNNRIKITIPTPNITEEFKAIPDKWWFTP